ncbi:hypothetical protein E2562_039455 [Oryza meyeriana var. granulata]|uniref:DUF1618 domain-containing protein n=1 Tax=Oryza meyeriana var. granulata TaxID=110450 RepID=A0A6G1E998_9ORYZ|nr:hypothetical protein E2562_039455 [Oryza meyeriana var. granulata]
MWPTKGRSCFDQWMHKDVSLPWGDRCFFCQDVVFSFKGKTFWADLTQGFMCCDNTDLFFVDSVDFRYVSFHWEYLLLDIMKSEELGPMEMYRTMGSSRDSIKFISINSACTVAAVGQAIEEPCHCHATTVAGNATVVVWTLDQASLSWKKMWSLA